MELRPFDPRNLSFTIFGIRIGTSVDGLLAWGYLMEYKLLKKAALSGDPFCRRMSELYQIDKGYILSKVDRQRVYTVEATFSGKINFLWITNRVKIAKNSPNSRK
ncbi:hypothetical protein CRG98_000064 [Punica granatum]|uniref:Uncharacterized protein n=1 Tax=Punica granatum TaxID=22663 RepID=A0A2I0LFY7_PUNGR|nr:hypothetical protein CRG98_000064 [Punica granatum]